MTKEEVSEYIIRGDIPMSFIWEDNVEYFFWIWSGQWFTSSYIGNPVFPYGEEDNGYPEITFLYNKSLYKKEIREHDSFKTILSDFLYWFELNKSRCKSIIYYESPTV